MNEAKWLLEELGKTHAWKVKPERKRVVHEGHRIYYLGDCSCRNNARRYWTNTAEEAYNVYYAHLGDICAELFERIDNG